MAPRVLRLWSSLRCRLSVFVEWLESGGGGGHFGVKRSWGVGVLGNVAGFEVRWESQ